MDSFKIPRDPWMLKTFLQKLSMSCYLLAASEPIHVENLGQFTIRFFHAQPVRQIISCIVTEERTHGERIVHDGAALIQHN